MKKINLQSGPKVKGASGKQDKYMDLEANFPDLNPFNAKG